ncbi:MAG: hypothetical protein L3J74_09330 [Bacteroidales bacterium]|nr:hypothetical protein [Bacteroidales bacterium]
MENILAKYKQLDDPILQKQVLDFIDYLLKVKSITQSQNLEEYKKRLLEVSTWTDEELSVFDNISKQFNKWKIGEL